MKTSNYIRTDLACERHRADTELPGVFYEETAHGDVTQSLLHITSKEGAASVGKPCGQYITLSFRPLWEQSDDTLVEIASLLGAAVAKLLPKKHPRDGRTLLIAGLGNRHLTVDAVGPRCAQSIVATSHLAIYEPAVFRTLGCDRLAVLAPGVLSQTGIESATLIAGAVKEVQADAVIVIDALVARSCSRLASTVQISDTGILPGGGVGNPRIAVDEESMGVPVIVIGIPTVVDASTLIYDTLTAEEAQKLPPSCKAALDKHRGFFVSPRECDAVTENAARLIAHALNTAFGVGSNLTVIQ